MTLLDKKEIQNIIRQFNGKKQKRDNSVAIEKVLLIAVSSAVGGALLGILFAPEKGKKTRRNLVKKSDGYLRELKKNSDELSKQLKNNTDSILKKSKETVQNFKKDAEEFSDQTYQELYDLAKELKIKGYSQMNKSELIQALENQ